MYRIFLVLLLAIGLFFNEQIFSQGSTYQNTSSLNIGFPSPNASAMARFSEIPVNYSTGIPEIVIPLYSADSRQLSIPISLQYHASGIRVAETAGWAGLGWSLNAGGAITRVMRGLPDDTPNGYYNKGGNTQNFATGGMTAAQRKQYYKEVSLGQLDAEPDLFYLNTGGITASFMFKENQTILIFPHQNLKILPTLTNGTISKWVVTDETGVLYHFEQTEMTYTATLGKSGNDFGGILPQTFVSTWYLTKIEYPGGNDEITIGYGSSQHTNPMSVDMNSTRTNYISFLFPCSGSESNYIVQNTNTTYNKFPNQITTPTEKIIFNTIEQSGVPMSTQLSSIEVRMLGSNQLVKKIDFTYGNTGSLPRRLLNSITVKGTSAETEPPYLFEYFTDQTLPAYNSLSVDHWGYYNGITTNTTLFPAVSSPQFGSLSGANRNPDSTSDDRFMRAGSLKKITYPTGGSTTFTYESNQYYDSIAGQNKKAGGIRIKQVLIHDGIDVEKDMIKSYEYRNAAFSTRSSGYLVNGHLELFRYYDANESQNGCPYVIRRTKAEGTVIGQIVAYQRVSEYIHTVSNNKGYTHYDIQFAQETGRSLNQWKRGKILKRSDYVTGGSLLQEKTYTHNFAREFISNVYGVEVSIAWIGNMDTTYTDRKFNFSSYWATLDGESLKIFDPGSGGHVETSLQHTYASGIRQLRSTTETNSDLLQRITEFTYAHEITNDGTGKNYSGMKTINMLAQVYSTTTANSSGGVVAKKWTRWDNVSGKWRPREEWLWKGSSYTDITAPINFGGSETIKILTLNTYDPFGNYTVVTDASGQVINYYYGSGSDMLSQAGLNGVNGFYLTAIEQVNPAGTNLVQKALYDTYGRIINLWDYSDIKWTYGYDSFGRLVSLTDNDLRLVEAFQYHLPGNNFSASNPNYIQTTASGSSSVTYIQTQYFDGLGRPTQHQGRDGTFDIVSSVEYDAQGRAWRQWKPYHQSNSSHVYRSNFASEANTYYSTSGAGPDAASRAYIETHYYNDTFTRAQTKYPEGVSDSAKSVRYSYGVETISNLKYSYTEVTDESDKKTRTYNDGWGRTFRTIVGYGTLDSSITGYEYDLLNRLTKVISPEGRLTHYRYNQLGQLIAKSTPDADGSANGNPASETGTGTSVDFDYIYNNAGSLVAFRDPNRKSAGQFVFYEYDFSGRKTQEGICTGTFPTLPCTNKSQTVTYIYDNESVGSAEGFTITKGMGRITKAVFPGGYYLYSYHSANGLVTNMYVKLDNLPGKIVTYLYDWRGELTRVQYQAGQSDSHTIWYTYDQAGRLKLVRSNTTTTQVTDADYTYWPAGMVNTELLGNQTVTFGYDARNRLLTINNTGSSTPKFSATYSYFDNSNINVAQYRQPSSPHAQKRYRYTHSYDSRNQLLSAIYVSTRPTTSWIQPTGWLWLVEVLRV